MTWVLGSAVMFGYGALIADVQVSWPDGRTRDVLQKIHPVGRMLMAGFSGSVKIGFHLVGDMQRFFALPEGQMARPTVAAWHWHRRGRRIFGAYPEPDRNLGAQLLLVGISPDSTGPIPTARCIRMQSPEFLPEIAHGIRWLSIGRGAQTEHARQYADDAYRREFLESIAMTERTRGGAAFSTAVSVAMDLTRHPVTGVSNALQIGTAFVEGPTVECLIQTFGRGAWSGWTKGDCPALCRTFDEYKALADREGLTASGGAA